MGTPRARSAYRVVHTVIDSLRRLLWRKNHAEKDSFSGAVEAEGFLRALVSDSEEGPDLCRSFLVALAKYQDEFSAALGRNLEDEELMEMILLLLTPVARNGFRDEATKNMLFDRAQGVGVHILPVHYYNPIPDTSSIRDHTWSNRFDIGWEKNVPTQLRLLGKLARWANEIADTPADWNETSPSEFFWNNPAFDPLDAIVYYSMIREFRPKRILEVGSGYSTLVAAKAAVTNGTTIVDCVEPYPPDFLTDGIDGVGRLMVSPVQDVPLDEFESLGANDILFIDGSHISMVDSDVNFLVLKVLPLLGPGVLIHFHDIYLPWDYPEEWVKSRKIFWNEQYLVLAFLLFNDSYEVILANHYLGKMKSEAVRDAFPFSPVFDGGSLWLKRAVHPNL